MYVYIYALHIINYDVHIYVGNNGSCEGCFSTRICTNATGTYLQFSTLFNPSLSSSHSLCELRHLNGSFNRIINEESLAKLSPDAGYMIQCPICSDNYSINYIIPRRNVSNADSCSNSGIHVN